MQGCLYSLSVVKLHKKIRSCITATCMQRTSASEALIVAEFSSCEYFQKVSSNQQCITTMALTCSPASSLLTKTSSSNKRAAYASFKPAATARTARVRVNAAIQDAAVKGAIDRRSMLAFSAVLPLMLQQSAVADEGKSVSVSRLRILTGDNSLATDNS